MSLAPQPYEHSGGIGSSLIVVPLAGLIASLVFGLAYAYVDVYSPIGGWISILFVLGFAFAVGAVTVMAIKGSKCRNSVVATILAIVVGLLALYCAWVCFLFVLFRKANAVPFRWSDLPALFFSPAEIWQWILTLNQTGWFMMFGGQFNGPVLWICWAIEAAIILGVLALFGRYAIVGEVFCELCHAWTDDSETLRLSVPEQMEELQSLAAGHLTELYQLEPVAVDEFPRIQVETKRCCQCEKTIACQIKAMTRESDKQGNIVDKAQHLTKFLVITPDEYDRLVSLARRPIEVEPDETSAASNEADSSMEGDVG